MPYVKIKITDSKISIEQKKRLMQGVTQLLLDILDKSPQKTTVIIEEINPDNWGVGGIPLTELEKDN